MMWRAPGTGLIAALSILACVSPAPVQRPALEADVPANWDARPLPAAGVSDAWWEEFGDARLDQAVLAALENNRDLRAAAARVEQAVAQATIAGADLKPAVGFNLDGSRRKQAFVGFPLPGGGVLSTKSTAYGASLDLSWEVDLWGRLAAGARAAVADLQAVEADYAGARLSLAGQVAKAWLTAAEAAQQVELSRRTVASWRRSSEQVRDRYERGVRSPLDLRLSLANLANAEALLETRLRQQDLAIRQIELLLGRYPGRDIPEPAVMPEVPRTIPGGLPAELIARRPDLVAAERQLAAADQRLLVARRSLYPRFSLTASGGTISTQLADLVDGDFSVWSIVGNLFQPIFQGGRLRAGVELADAGTEAAFESYVSAALVAYTEVETALAADAYLVKEDERLRESSRQSAAARQLAEERYAAGLEDYITVLESQRRELVSEATALSVRRQRLTNRVDLYLALGGGYLRPDAALEAEGERRSRGALRASSSSAIEAKGVTP
jgi:NodT family efflux transporter outer membrane factor (OMF) lipoprotein